MNTDNKSDTKYVMVESSPIVDDDEVELLELIRSLLQSWKLIVFITIISTGLAVTYALYSQEIFKAEVLLAPAQEEKSGVPSSIGQLGGLAAMAGISIPSGSNTEQVIATLESRKFLFRFIKDNSLLSVLYDNLWDADKKVWIVDSKEDEPNEQASVEFFKEILSVNEDKKSGLVTLSVSWKEPEIAAQWANDLVKQLNEQLREQAIEDSQKRVGYLEKELAKTTLKDMREVLYKLLESEKQKAMLANVNEDFALEVIDPAVAPETRDKPKRKLIVVLGGVCGAFLGVFSVYFLQFLAKIKSSSKERSNPSHV
ncbi:MAG: hypothetical protein CMI26_01570 [Opitutae bacterium]|nr:hypothetical protein [Opitutae bacterium]